MASERGVRNTWFPMLVYEEQIEAVRQNLALFGYKYAICKHDKDLNERGEVKKVHWHVVVICGKIEYQFTLANRLGVERRFVERPLSTEPNGAIRYLTHIDNPEKAQYDRESIETNIEAAELERLHQKAEKRSKDEENEELLNDIERLATKSISYKDFFRAHPAFIYQANSLLKLVQIASDVQWTSTIDKETGEIIS